MPNYNFNFRFFAHTTDVGEFMSTRIALRGVTLPQISVHSPNTLFIQRLQLTADNHWIGVLVLETGCTWEEAVLAYFACGRKMAESGLSDSLSCH